MNKQEVMENVWKKNGKYTSVGDLIFALSKRWPNKRSSFSDEAINFINEKKKEHRKKLNDDIEARNFLALCKADIEDELKKALRGERYENIGKETSSKNEGFSLANAFEGLKLQTI